MALVFWFSEVSVLTSGTFTPVATVTLSVSTEICITTRRGENRLLVIAAEMRMSRKPSA